LLSGGTKTPHGTLGYNPRPLKQKQSYGVRKAPVIRKEIIIEGDRFGYNDSELADGELCNYIIKNEELSQSVFKKGVSKDKLEKKYR
jgi:hypothetical protein